MKTDKEMLKIRAIIFDLDDTLTPEWQYQVSGFRFVSEYLSKKYAKKQNIFLNFLKKDYFKGRRTKNYNRLIKRFRLKENISHLVALHRNHFPKIYFYQDARYVLNKFKNKYKLGIISDGNKEAQENKIKSLQLANVVPAIIITEAQGNKAKFCKPSEKSFLKILKILKVQPRETIYVGDNPQKDFIGPKKIGMRTVHILRKDGEYYNVKTARSYQADYKISSLKEIEKIIAQINEKSKN